MMGNNGRRRLPCLDDLQNLFRRQYRPPERGVDNGVVVVLPEIPGVGVVRRPPSGFPGPGSGRVQGRALFHLPFFQPFPQSFQVKSRFRVHTDDEPVLFLVGPVDHHERIAFSLRRPPVGSDPVLEKIAAGPFQPEGGDGGPFPPVGPIDPCGEGPAVGMGQVFPVSAKIRRNPSPFFGKPPRPVGENPGQVPDAGVLHDEHGRVDDPEPGLQQDPVPAMGIRRRAGCQGFLLVDEENTVEGGVQVFRRRDGSLVDVFHRGRGVQVQFNVVGQGVGHPQPVEKSGQGFPMGGAVLPLPGVQRLLELGGGVDRPVFGHVIEQKDVRDAFEMIREQDEGAQDQVGAAFRLQQDHHARLQVHVGSPPGPVEKAVSPLPVKFHDVPGKSVPFAEGGAGQLEGRFQCAVGVDSALLQIPAKLGQGRQGQKLDRDLPGFQNAFELFRLSSSTPRVFVWAWAMGKG